MILLNIAAYVLLVAGPLGGYFAADHAREPARRWHVIAAAGLGGAIAAVVLIAALFLSEISSRAAAGQMLRSLVVTYTVFGLLLGLISAMVKAGSPARFVGAGLVLLGLLTLGRAAVDAAAHRPPGIGASGVVIGPDNRAAVGAVVFVDRGSGAIERLTTDARGMFRVPRKLFAVRRPLILICVPGAIPYGARPDEHLITPESYQMSTLPPRAMVTPGIRAFGWQRRPVPRECLAGLFRLPHHSWHTNG